MGILTGSECRCRVLTYRLPPYGLVLLRSVKQVTYLTGIETQAVHSFFRTDKVFCTRLFVGTQFGTVGEDEAVLSCTSYIAHDMTIVIQSVILSRNSVLVAVTGFNARSIGLFAH